MSEEIKPKKEKRFLKTLGKVGEILLQEVLLKLGSSIIKKIGGKKTLPSILFLLASLSLFAQYPATGNKQRLGYQTTGDGLVWRGSISDTASIQPINNQNAWVILDTINLKIYSFDFTSNAWNALPQDTTSLSNRINLKLNLSDTASMLTPYFKDADTSLLNLTSRFAAKLNISDTASMLTNYLRTGVAASTYLPLTGGTLTGGLTGTTALFSGNVAIGFPFAYKPLEVISNANDFVSVGVNALGKYQWSGIHFGYREADYNYRKSAIVFQKNEAGPADASGKVHLLNVNSFEGSRNADLRDAKLTIGNNGFVGINDTSPSFNLDVGGTLGVTGAATFIGNVAINTTTAYKPVEAWANANDFVSVGVRTLNTGQFSGIHFGYVELNTDYRKSAIVFQRTDYTGGFDASGSIHLLNVTQGQGARSADLRDAKLTINNNGNVGINDTTPSYNLDVGGTLGVTGATTLSAPLTVNSSAVFNEGSADADFRVESDANINMVFVDASTDRVGLGTNTPSKTLEVNGEVKIATVTATPTSLLGKDGSNVVGEVTSVNQSGFMYAAKRLNNNTDAAGELIFAHGLSWTPSFVFAQVLYGTNLYINPKSVDGTNITLRVYDNDGNAVANTSINAFQWMAIK